MIAFAVRRPQQNQMSITEEGLKTAGLSAITNPRLVRF